MARRPAGRPAAPRGIAPRRWIPGPESVRFRAMNRTVTESSPGRYTRRAAVRRRLSSLALTALGILVPAALAGQSGAPPGAATAGAATAPQGAPKPTVQYDDRGIVFSGTDGFSYLILRFRVQQLAQVTSEADDDLDVASANLAVRRMRLRFESVVWDPRLKVNVQLSFTRGDQDFEASNFPNVLRDAYVTWQATPRLALVGGQGKLPGNRQRVNSSSELQFADRSIVNAAFTIDRDVGLFAHYTNMDAALPFVLRGAVTAGEGRNPSPGSDGLAYTGRVELLPFGAFTGGGDYFEGDLRREPHPKLSVAFGAQHNDRAVRAGGQLGRPLFAPRSMNTYLADLLYKHRGFAFAAEVARRTAPDPVTTDGTTNRFVLVGDGVTAQTSYLMRSNLETAVRFSLVTPHDDVAGLAGADRQRQVGLGLTRYFKGHKVKVQGELLHDDFRNQLTGAKRGAWGLRSSMEVGI